MLRQLLSFLGRHATVVTVAFLALAGTAFAVSGTSARKSRTFYACVTEESGTLNLTTRTASCARGQRKISFNANGRTGARGRSGAAGATGPAGATGAPGPEGPQGERAPSVFGSPGTKGDKGDTGPTRNTTWRLPVPGFNSVSTCDPDGV
jgi:hypothetical protein